MKNKLFLIVNLSLLVVLVLFVGTNQVLIAKTNDSLGISKPFLGVIRELGFSNNSGNINLSGDLSKDAIGLVISQGVPEIYGEELGVTFDKVQKAMDVIKRFDPDYGRKKIILAGNDLQRYIDIGLRISCEYCCSAASIITKGGRAACGCAHAQAMRGLIAYLVQNHGPEYSNDEILRETSRWKGMYYPKQTIKKMISQLQSGEYTPDIAALILNIDLPDYGGGKNAPLPSEIENLPSMIGGC